MVKDWAPPSGWTKFRAIDAHAAGEPLRIVFESPGMLPGRTILEKRRHLKEHKDWIRKVLMWEPRGHADMYGCVVTRPVSPDGTFGVIFLHNEGYSTMCGHGIIAVTKVLLDTGFIESTEERPVLKIDTPAGRVTAVAERKNGRVQRVCFENVPSFVLALDKRIDIPGIGAVSYDIAFGGAFYAFCRAEDFGFRLVPEEFSKLIELGMNIKNAVMHSVPIHHPEKEDLSYLYGTIFVGSPHMPAHHSRNVCIFAEGEVDRSPTGTGVSARAALHYARSEIAVKEPFVVESILGSCFTGLVKKITQVGPYAAVIPEVCGTAHITGRHEFFIDPDDPLKDGFIFR